MLCITNAMFVEHGKELLKMHFKCIDVRNVQDYMGCMTGRLDDGRSLTMTQPVLAQSLTDEFEDIVQGRLPLVPLKPVDILIKCKIVTSQIQNSTDGRW